MTGEEMERAIEFLLKNQAGFDVRLNRLADQVGETNRQLQMYAETQTEFIKVVSLHIEAQGQINAELRKTQARIADDLRVLASTVQRIAEARG